MGTIAALAESGFQKRLAFGQIAETDIARWIMTRGGIVLPIYDIEYETGKGPRLFGINQKWVAPDLLVFKAGKLTWIEAKHKTAFTWYRIGQRWTTGIDLCHYSQYRQVQTCLEIPVWLLFFHQNSIPSDIDRRYPTCPDHCPTGLFGGSLDELTKKESHRSNRHGQGGMVYWAKDSLTYLASIEEVHATVHPADA